MHVSGSGTTRLTTHSLHIPPSLSPMGKKIFKLKRKLVSKKFSLVAFTLLKFNLFQERVENRRQFLPFFLINWFENNYPLIIISSLVT